MNKSETFSVHSCTWIRVCHNKIMFRGVWACFFNDSASYSCHHFSSTNSTRRRMLNIVITDKWHIVSIWGTSSNCATSCNYISCTCVNNRISCSCCHSFCACRNVVFILILARNLLRSLMNALRWWISWLSRELFTHKFGHTVSSNQSDAFLASLTIDHADIYAWGPIFVTLWLGVLAVTCWSLLFN